LQYSSDEEEKRCGRADRPPGSYATLADVNELRMMVGQSHSIQRDRHNKMRGRGVQDWQSDEGEEPRRAARIHTSDQLPRRRKKKGHSKKGEQSDEKDDAGIQQAWQSHCETTRNLHWAASSLSRQP